MQLSNVFVSLALAASVLADSESFGLLLIRSGSNYQYSSIANVDDKLEIGTDGVTATITDDGKLKIGEGQYAVVGSDNAITVGSDGSASFSISGGYLEYNAGGFSLNSGYALIAGSSGVNPVAVRPTSKSGSAAPDFTPSGSSNSSSNDTTISSSSASVVTQTDNGAMQYGVGAGVGAIAAAFLF